MVFSTLIFLFLYLPITLLVYYFVPARFRNLWIFVISMLFYGWGEPVYIILMLITITVNYVSGILIGRYRNDGSKARWILLANTVICLGLLGFYKYTDLFIDTVNDLFGLYMANKPELKGSSRANYFYMYQPFLVF